MLGFTLHHEASRQQPSVWSVALLGRTNIPLLFRWTGPVSETKPCHTASFTLASHRLGLQDRIAGIMLVVGKQIQKLAAEAMQQS